MHTLGHTVEGKRESLDLSDIQKIIFELSFLLSGVVSLKPQSREFAWYKKQGPFEEKISNL